MGESQRSPHAWSATAAAHAYLGMGLWGGFAVLLDRWSAVYIAPLAYLILIECIQLLLASKIKRSLVWDSCLDTVVFTFGCIAAAYLRDGNINMAMAAWAASMAVIAAGWMVRDA